MVMGSGVGMAYGIGGDTNNVYQLLSIDSQKQWCDRVLNVNKSIQENSPSATKDEPSNSGKADDEK